MRVEASSGIASDRVRAEHGKTIVLSSNRSEAVFLTCVPGKRSIWYVQAHLSTEAAEGEMINEPFYYYGGVGYVKISWESIAMMSSRSSLKKWEEIYRRVQSRKDNGCPFKDGQCPQIYCPFRQNCQKVPI